MKGAIKRIFALGVTAAIFGCAVSAFAYQQSKPAAAAKGMSLPAQNSLAEGARANDYLALHLDMIGVPFQADATDVSAMTTAAVTHSCPVRTALEARLGAKKRGAE